MRYALAIVVLTLAACSNQKPAKVMDYGQYYYNKGTSGEAGSLADAERARQMRLERQVEVRKGDDLYAIAERYNTTTREIMEFNKLKPPYDLRPGQQLKISRPQVYVAHYGDTLQSIARKEGVDISELARINELREPFKIDTGQQIRLPYRAFDSGFYTSAKAAALPTSRVEVSALPAPRGTGKVESVDLPPVKSSAIESAPLAKTTYVLSPGEKEAAQPKQNFARTEEAPVREERVVSSWNPFSISEEEKVLPKTLDDEPVAEPVTEPVKPPVVERAKPETPKRQEIARLEDKPKPTVKEAAPAPRGSGAAIGFIWPLKGKVISDYGPQKGGINNEGINIAAPVGTAVKAAADGEVIYTGTGLKSYGKLVIVKHKNGWVTAYAHNSEILVKSGQNVRQGQTISKVGNSGRVEKPQLHFAIRQGREAVDPLDYLGS